MTEERKLVWGMFLLLSTSKAGEKERRRKLVWGMFLLLSTSKAGEEERRRKLVWGMFLLLSTYKAGEASCWERSGCTQSRVFERLIDGTLQPPQRVLYSWRTRVS